MIFCPMGKHAKPMTAPALPDEIGRTFAAKVCQDCWTSWFKDYSVKVINNCASTSPTRTPTPSTTATCAST